MRSLACIVLMTVPLAVVCAREVEPYEARVIVARAQVRSGPGESFYPTDSLAQGEAVEVYREEGDEWLGIRPPPNSFSWVFGRHLTLRDDGLAEVAKPDAASRIGSRFGGSRNAVQVRLHQGEVVEILGEMREDGETWYKIAPPAGEFRWIHRTQVEPTGAIESAEPEAKPLVVATSATEDATPLEATDESAVPEKASVETPPAGPVAEVPANDAWRAAATDSAADRIAAPPLASSGNEPDSGATAPASASAEPGEAASQRSIASTEQQPLPLERQLTDLELRLSRMVAAPPEQWNTERLERDGEALLAEAATADQREALKSLLAKLDRFEAIGRQYRAAPAEVPAQQTAAAGSQQPVVGQRRSEDQSPALEHSEYDAVGILRPVVSRRPGAPQFALVDDRGQVVSFVTPTPDMNLQPLVGHRVGVTGTRGYIPEFQRAHVTAGRVAPLDERLLR